MSYDVYIGDLADCSWNPTPEEWNIGNAPTRQSPFFPAGGFALFREVWRRVESGEWDGKQVDWGAWVARLYPREIMAFIEEQYASKHWTGLPHLEQWLDDLRRYVQQLDSDQVYALVASEL